MDKLKTSEVKVRKVLITENLWQSKTSLEIEYLEITGMSGLQEALAQQTWLQAAGWRRRSWKRQY